MQGTVIASEQGRAATQPYRVRVGGVWYWVDPTVPPEAIEPCDMVMVYPVAGHAVLATLQSRLAKRDNAALPQPIVFSTLVGERFEVPARDIAALHLAAVDDQQ